MLREDLGLRAYKKIVEPMLTDEHKEKRKNFENFVWTTKSRQSISGHLIKRPWFMILN